MEKKSREEITLEISNYWLANDYFTERNKNCGTLVAFDWIGDKTCALTTGVKDMAVKAWNGVKNVIPTK